MVSCTIYTSLSIYINPFNSYLFYYVFKGFGKFIMADGSFYEGQFKDGEITGNGLKLNKQSGTEYKGEFFEGCYHGKGHLRSKISKLIYQGDFHNNMRHGFGELFEVNTNRNYKGQWYLNKRQGQGIQHYTDGSTYSGSILFIFLTNTVYEI